MAQKTRREAERKRGVEENKKKKRMLEYLQQLQNKVLAEDAEGSQIMGSKYKEILLEDDRDCRPFKKVKGKQLVRYHRKIGVKIGNANLCEKYMYAR